VRGGIHPTAAVGYEAAADGYARARPPSPTAAIAWLLAAVGAAAGIPSVKVVDGRAEELPLADGSVRSILASQSLHWCDVPVSLAEFARVLAPAGRVGLVWNLRDTDVAWQRDLDALLADTRGDAPHSRDGRWQAAVAESNDFDVEDACSWRWTHATDVAGVVERVRSVSYIATLAAAERDEVCAATFRIMQRHLGVRDSAAGVDFPYVTEAYALARTRHVSGPSGARQR
jgi:SAM-dependent methyltransferase